MLMQHEQFLQQQQMLQQLSKQLADQQRQIQAVQQQQKAEVSSCFGLFAFSFTFWQPPKEKGAAVAADAKPKVITY